MLTDFFLRESITLVAVEEEVFNHVDLLQTYSEPAWTNIIEEVPVILTGYQYMPYHSRHRYQTIPGLCEVSEAILPCLIFRVLRLFRQGNDFNMHVMALSVNSARTLQLFPCTIQILVITALLQMRQFRAHTDMQKARDASLLSFVDERRAIFYCDEFPRKFIKDLDVTWQHIAADIRYQRYGRYEHGGINMRRPPHLEKGIIHAIAV
jgi:hypothetical protein